MMLRCALRAAGLAAQRLPAALASTPASAAGCAIGVRMLTATCAAGAPAAGLASELQRLAFLPVSVRALHGSVRTLLNSKYICSDSCLWRVANLVTSQRAAAPGASASLPVQALCTMQAAQCTCMCKRLQLQGAARADMVCLHLASQLRCGDFALRSWSHRRSACTSKCLLECAWIG